jgi:hypothetical protein
MLSVAVADCPALVAFTVKFEVPVVVGVPVIAPDGERPSPAGN